MRDAPKQQRRPTGYMYRYRIYDVYKSQLKSWAYMFEAIFLLEIPMDLSFSAIPSDRIKVSKELLIWMVIIRSAAVMKMMPSMIPNPLEQPTKPTKNSRLRTSRMTFRQHPRHDLSLIHI